MNVLVDTSVWSLAFRRKSPGSSPVVRELVELIREGRAVLIGPVRQEVLSGIRAQEQFDKLRERLRAFPDWPLGTEDYEEAAVFFNRCQAQGLQGSNTDFLLSAVGVGHGMSLFTTDHDFLAWRDTLGITLHTPRFPER